MPLGLVLDLARSALTTAILLASPLLGVAMVVGLIVSLVQAVKRIWKSGNLFVKYF